MEEAKPTGPTGPFKYVPGVAHEPGSQHFGARFPLADSPSGSKRWLSVEVLVLNDADTNGLEADIDLFIVNEHGDTVRLARFSRTMTDMEAIACLLHGAARLVTVQKLEPL